MPSHKLTVSTTQSATPAGSSSLSSNAAAVAAFRARQRAAGLTEINLWVPSPLADLMRVMARAVTEMHAKEKS